MSSVSLPVQSFGLVTASWEIESPTVDSTGYTFALGNRPNWPSGPCVYLVVQKSDDNGLTWEDESANTFAGAVTGRGGVPIPAASVSGSWPTIMVGGQPVVQRPTRMRFTADFMQAIDASVNATWV